MQPIKVLFFASLREQFDKDSHSIASDSAISAKEVWRRSSSQDSLPNNILISVNQEYANMESMVQPGDEVAFFPPVTGG